MNAYIRHLVSSGEILGAVLLSTHNVKFLLNLSANLAKAIENDSLSEFAADFYAKYYDG